MLSHHRAGAGEPLLLIHGIGSRWQVWRPILPELERHFEVIAVDLPGFGASAPRPGDRWDAADYADAVGAFLAALGITACHVAGSSLGGGIALELGHLGLARSVTAFAPVGFWSGAGRRWCQASVSGARTLGGLLGPALPWLAASQAARVLLFSMFFAHPARLEPDECVADVAALRSAPGFAAARRGFAGWQFRPGPSLDRIPVTIAWGSRDAILPRRRQARRATIELPLARHETLDGCGHLPFSDDPARCVALILASAGVEPAAPTAAGAGELSAGELSADETSASELSAAEIGAAEAGSGLISAGGSVDKLPIAE